MNISSEKAHIAFYGANEVDTFSGNSVLFKGMSMQKFQYFQCPPQLEGLFFLRGCPEGTEFRITKSGSVVVLAVFEDEMERLLPFPERSQFRALERQMNDGCFEILDIQPFRMTVNDKPRLFAAYGKNVQKGQVYRFGADSIVLGFEKAIKIDQKQWDENTGEILYNGIRLPEHWPPMYTAASKKPMPVPYLDYPPQVINIDVGRQLLFDDFLIEATDLERVFHKPKKYEGNPVLKPETELEINSIRRVDYEKGEPGNAAAAPKSGGVWWDSDEQVFKMWYEAGWIGTVAYAISKDGINWHRPELAVVEGTNQVLPIDLIADSWTVFPNYGSNDPQAKWNMFIMPPVGGAGTGWSLTSPDGINWNKRAQTGIAGDRSTHFYNPFRNKWVYSLRVSRRFGELDRARLYRESDNFLEGASWSAGDKLDWIGSDDKDPVDYLIREKPQLYNLDAVGYESIMLGFYQIYHGPDNEACMEAGLPKITELMFAYSRDGFHWDRPDRRAHIPSQRSDVWDRGYVQSVGGVCLVRGDKLWFYYSAFRGDSSRRETGDGGLGDNWMSNGMYANGATGIATLRRDGFASMDAASSGGALTTRPLKFSGKHLFVNASVGGKLRAQILDTDGNPIEPFTFDNCIPFTGDSTIEQIKWQGGSDLSELAGKPLRIAFELTNGSLYSFWVSKDSSGRSDGYVAAGGPGYVGNIDTAGIEALEIEKKYKSIK